MGSENSKPDYVSDAAWERIQAIPITKIPEKETEIKEVDNQKVASVDYVVRLTSDVADYYSKCHDIPSILMLFPGYRKECAAARAAVLKDMTVLIDNAISDETGSQVIATVKKI